MEVLDNFEQSAERVRRAQQWLGGPGAVRRRLRVPDEQWRSLSERQRDYVLRVARGLTNAQIAEELGVSLGTANNMIARTMARLGVANRVELTLWTLAHKP